MFFLQVSPLAFVYLLYKRKLIQLIIRGKRKERELKLPLVITKAFALNAACDFFDDCVTVLLRLLSIFFLSLHHEEALMFGFIHKLKKAFNDFAVLYDTFVETRNMRKKSKRVIVEQTACK